MKRLWKYVPPCLSDIQGFQDVISHTDGLGVIDDSSGYKPLNFSRRGGPGGRPGKPEGGEGRPGTWGERPGGWHGRPEGGEGRPGGHPFAGGGNPMRHGGRPGGGHGRGGGRFEGVRVVTSDIQETDAVNGTEGKVLAAFENNQEHFQPKFALLTCAPCASMINTDLNDVAERIQEKYNLPAAAVALDGQKDYLYGVSLTLEAMGKLLLEQRETIPGAVNLLGCNTIDWPESAVKEAEAWLTAAGFQVLTRWGAQETAENLNNAAAASINLVVNVSGLRLARYMEQEFGIPYVVGAPFGKEQCVALLEQLKGGCAPEMENGEDAEVLILGEQLTANAIRAALLERGWKGVKVCSFFEMDKTLMGPGDKKLVSEDELAEVLSSGSLKLVLGDTDYRLPAGESVKWAPLPNPANNAPSASVASVSFVNGALDRWLDENL